jgi:spermidine synthase
MITHVPLAVHPNAKNILVTGGGDGGAVRELCRYRTVKAIDLVEIDPWLLRPPGAPALHRLQLRRPRVTIYYETGEVC